MPPLPVLRAADIIRALERAGFEVTRQRGSHIRMVQADSRVVTVPDHGSHDIGRGLLRKILRDAELSVDDLLQHLN